MNYQRCYPTLVSLYRPILRTKSLVIFLLVSLLNVSSYPLYAEQHAQSEENSVKELIDKVGKPKLTLFIRKLRQNHITVDVNGTLRDFSGSPDLTYITPRSLLHDIHQVGLSVEQAAAAYRRADKMAKERKLKARIEAEEAEVARIEEERKRIARKRALEKNGRRRKTTRSSDPNTRVTKGGHIAAVSEALLDKAIRYIYVDNDLEALQILLDTGLVIFMKEGLEVHIVDTKIWSGKVKIRVRGTTQELWTSTSSITKG